MGIINIRIKQMRMKKGLTLLQVANLLGIKEATMQRYESGEIKNIKYETIEQLAKIFDCTPSYLTGWMDSLDAIADNNSLLSAVYSLNLTNKDLSKQDIADIIDYINLLKRKNQMLNAAHERTDIIPTTEDKINDEDIMNDDIF